MSFALEIKREILEQEFSLEQAQAFVSGLISASGQRDGSSYILKMNNNDISNFIRDLIEQMSIKHRISKENKNWIIFDNFEIQEEIRMPSQYFAGIFVAGGSISDQTSTNYHLEMQFYSHLIAKRVQTFLNKYEFDFSLIQRRKNWVLYIKKSEQISDFLRAIQAVNALMTFEDERINRDFKNQLNRYSNLDSYNQNKLAKATKKFLDKYKFIKDNGLTHLFREQELIFFELKKNNPYSSLEELTKFYKKKTGIDKTRAGLSHYLIKLRTIYEENN